MDFMRFFFIFALAAINVKVGGATCYRDKGEKHLS